MKTHIFKGKLTKTITVDNAGETWHLLQNARIQNVDTGMDSAFDNSRIIVDGSITARAIGILSTGFDNRIQIGAKGSIIMTDSTSIGVAAQGAGAAVSNAGDIRAFEIGVGLYEPQSSVRNSGLITGSAGVFVHADEVTVLNGRDGIISARADVTPATASAINIKSVPDAVAQVVNHGLLKATGKNLAIYGGNGEETLISDGRIKGDIDLGDGNDLADLRGGKFTGRYLGGMGDDMLITDNARFTLTEMPASGDDTVRSTVTYKLTANVENLFLLGKRDLKGFGEEGNNQIHGNAGDNVLKGFAGNDKLFGGKGNDVLVGGADGDFFQFATGWGHDRIADFQQGLDIIDVSSWKGIDDFTEVFQHARDTNAGVVITLGHDSLTVVGMTRAEMVGGDFMF